MTIPPDTRAGKRLRLRGMGLLAEQGERGDYQAIVRLALPERLTPEQIELLRALRDASLAKPGATSSRGAADG